MSFDAFFPLQLCLQTDRVLMRAMTMDDLPTFSMLSSSDILWKYFSKELNDRIQLLEWMESAIEERKDKKRFPFTVIEKSSGNICGSTSLGNISFFDKRIEIGWTWLAEPYLGSGINTHCKYALLKYAFEVLLFERVEIKTDNLNERAKNALRKIGAIEEGVLRSHTQMPNNRRRDSVFFSILKNEWQQVKEKRFRNVENKERPGKDL